MNKDEECRALGGGEARNEEGRARSVIKSYEDLDVYQNSYKGMLIIFRKILCSLPVQEKYDLVDQLRRSSKAIPRLIAEGHSKRHQAKGFQKYIDDAHAESNETIVSLTQAKDLYATIDELDLYCELIDLYDKISRQLFRLSASWRSYSKDRR